FCAVFYLVMCFSAVYLNHHYLLDVLWGSAYALLIGYGTDLYVMRRLAPAFNASGAAASSGGSGSRWRPEGYPRGAPAASLGARAPDPDRSECARSLARACACSP